MAITQRRHSRCRSGRFRQCEVHCPDLSKESRDVPSRLLSSIWFSECPWEPSQPDGIPLRRQPISRSDSAENGSLWSAKQQEIRGSGRWIAICFLPPLPGGFGKQTGCRQAGRAVVLRVRMNRPLRTLPLSSCFNRQRVPGNSTGLDRHRWGTHHQRLTPAGPAHGHERRH